MILPILLEPEARQDIAQACDWYNRQRFGLGDEFLEFVAGFIERIRHRPESCEVVLRSVRRGKVERFPYVVYYRPCADCIQVLAVLHGSRDPRLWQERVQKPEPGTSESS